jgi:transcriptional regulator with XRE-family HTH domain
MREIEIRLAEVDSVPTDFLRALGSRIVQQRERHGWKQRELARRLGMDPDKLSKIERGIREPSITELMRLCKQLDCSLDDLVLGRRTTVDAALHNLLPPDEELKAVGYKLFEAVAGGWDLVLRMRRQQAERPR